MSLSVDTFLRDHPFKIFCYLTRKQFVRKYFKFDRSNCLFITSQKCTYHQGVRTPMITLKDFCVFSLNFIIGRDDWAQLITCLKESRGSDA